MNERIKEILLQAEFEEQDGHISIQGVYMFNTTRMEKFAELIVQECLNVMSKTSEEANKRFTYMGDDVPTVVHQMNIEKHFGVKE